MRAAICEDEARERGRLTEFLRRFATEQGFEIAILEYESAEALLRDFGDGEQGDILFLDIYTGGMSGMDAAKAMFARGYTGSLVFCSSSKEHGVESYSVNADYYLLKPYGWEDFCRAMEKCRPRWTKNMKTVSFLCDRLETKVRIRDISFIETRRRGCVVHAKGEAMETRRPMREFAAELEVEPGFLCVSRAFLVNLAHMGDWDDEYIIMDDSLRVPLPVRERAEIRRRLTD